MSRGSVPVTELSHHYIQTAKNPPILDIFSRTRVSYILFLPYVARWET